MVVRSVLVCAVGVFSAAASAAQTEPDVPPTRREREARAYPLTTCVIPAEITLEVGGLALVDGPSGQRILAATRRGEVWAIDGFAVDVPTDPPTFELVAEGLHEPLGILAEPDRSLVLACRGQLTRLLDRDGDGRYEAQSFISDWWRISGNYHEYNFGPCRGVDGSYWIATNRPFGSQPFGPVDWRGYALRITPGGGVTPMCAGLRSPAGIAAAPWGEIFYTDNQGEWCGASKLSLLSPGSFHGHPVGLASASRHEWPWPVPKPLTEGETYAAAAAGGQHPTFQMPTVWFPYEEMGRSPAGLVWDQTGGKFGPFTGQVFVADQFDAAVFRVNLERVSGHWQGACFRFRDGLQCGALRVEFTDSGALLVGQTDRGWGSKGALTEGLQRIDWSGETPFEILTMRLLHDGAGFRLRFTAPASRESLTDDSAFALESYTYASTERYGSPELDRRSLSITTALPHADGLGVDLRVDGLREGYVHELDAGCVRAAESGLELLHSRGYYTLVRVW